MPADTADPGERDLAPTASLGKVEYVDPPPTKNRGTPEVL